MESDSARRAIRSLPEWESLRRRIPADAIRFAHEIEFDFREMLSDSAVAQTAGRLLWQLIKPLAPSVLVAPGYGGASILSWVAAAATAEGHALSLLMVRDKRKLYHRKKWVEGKRQPAGSRAVIVDDFMKGGSAVPLVEEALRADGHELDIAGVALFFDMWEPLGSRQLSVGRYPVVSLFRRHDIGLTRDCFDAAPPLMKGSFPAFVGEPLWWRFDLNTKAEHPFKSAPVIADDAVFVADDHCNVWRHDLRDGSIDWKYESLADAQKGIVQLMQYADGSVVFGCYDGTVARLDARTGRALWRVRQDTSIHATPALDLAHGRFFVNTEQWNGGSPVGRLIALDWSTGRLLWEHRHRYWAPGSPYYCSEGDAVVATCNDRTMACVDAASGALRWEFRTHGLVRGRPASSLRRVYAATETGRLHCVDLRTGEEIWTVRYGRGAMHAFPLAHRGRIYVLDGNWHLFAFDEESGELRSLTRLRGPGCWCPVPCGDYLVALSREGGLAVYDARREIKVWEDLIGGSYRQPPAVSGGYLAAASNDQGLKVFEIDSFYLH